MIKYLRQPIAEKWFLLLMLGVHLCITWPGVMTPDSQGQYQMALAGVYTDHHPFFMSFVWHYLDMLYPGSGMMLGLHLLLLYGAMFFLLQCFKQAGLKLLVLVLPLLPQIFVFSDFIWKDVGFAFSFLFVGSVLAFCTIKHKKLTLIQVLGLLIILAYGTLIKFQAQYLAPVLLVWLSMLFSSKKLKESRGLASLLGVFAGFYLLLIAISVMGPPVKQDHSWQYVKLYDLASISLDTDQSLFPSANQTKYFSMAKTRQLFEPQRVDQLVFGETAPLKKGDDEVERQELWQAWASAVKSHPMLYLKHRARNIGYAALSTPYFDKIQSYLLNAFNPESSSCKVAYIAARGVGFLFLASIVPILLSFIYFVLGVARFKSSRTAIPLLFFNGMAIVMLVTLYFFSMAGGPRYLYIIVCLVHASHGFAYLCCKPAKDVVN